MDLTQLKLTLKEKIETIKKLDEAILDMLEKSSEIISEIYGGLALIDNALKKLDEKKSSEVPVEITTVTNVSQNSHHPRADGAKRCARVLIPLAIYTRGNESISQV